jgi:outer membrane protein TolC
MHLRLLVLLSLMAGEPRPAVAQVVARCAKPVAARSELRLCAYDEDDLPPAAHATPAPQSGPSRTVTYTLADLEAMALASNPTRVVAGARVQAAEGAAVQAGLCPNPRIGYMANEIGNEGQAGLQGAFIEQEFVRGQGNVTKAASDLRAAEGEVRRLELHLQRRLAEAFERYTAAQQQVQVYDQDILPDAERSLQLLTLGYQQGEFGYVAVLTAQRTYFQTSLARLAALLELRRSIATIEGLLLEGSLEDRYNRPPPRRGQISTPAFLSRAAMTR